MKKPKTAPRELCTTLSKLTRPARWTGAESARFEEAPPNAKKLIPGARRITREGFPPRLHHGVVERESRSDSTPA